MDERRSLFGRERQQGLWLHSGDGRDVVFEGGGWMIWFSREGGSVVAWLVWEKLYERERAIYPIDEIRR